MAENSQEIKQIIQQINEPVNKPATTLIIGDGKVSVNSVVKTLEKNIDRYMEYKGFDAKEKDAFLTAYADFVDGLKSGQITGRGFDRKWNDKTGKRTNAAKGFDAYGEVAALADKIVAELATTPSADSGNKWSSADFTTYLKNKIFAGGLDEKTWNDLDAIDEATNKRGVTNRTAKILGVLDEYISDLANKEFDFTNTPFKDKEDLLNKLTHARQSIQNGVIDANAYYLLNAAGIDTNVLRQLLNEGGGAATNTTTNTDNTSVGTTNTDSTATTATTESSTGDTTTNDTTQTDTATVDGTTPINPDTIINDGLPIAETQPAAEEQKPNDGRTEEMKKRDARIVGNLQQATEQLTTSDYIRLGSAAADIVSAISAWAPGYGTAVSGITGVASSIGNLIADIGEDGFQLHDLTSFGANLAMDAAGLFGGAGKAGKIVKALTNIAPKLIVIWDAMANGKVYAAAMKKAINDTEHMTMADWKLIANGLTLIASGSRMGASAFKQHAMVKMAEPGKVNGKAKLKINTKEGEKVVEVDQEFAKRMHSAKTREEAQSLLNERFKTKTTKYELGPKGKNGRRKHSRIVTEKPMYELVEPGKRFFGRWGTDKRNPVQVELATAEGTPFRHNTLWYPFMPAKGVYNFNTAANQAKFGGEGSFLKRTFLPSDLDIMTGNIKPSLFNLPYTLKNNQGFAISGYNPYMKKGGVLKAQPGASLVAQGSHYSTDDKKKEDEDFSQFVKDNEGTSDIFGSTVWNTGVRYRNSVNDKNELGYTERGSKGDESYSTNSNKANPENNEYDIEPGNGSEIERKNVKFYEQLENNPELAEIWARQYVALNTVKNSNWSNGWFDANDKFNFEKFRTSNLWKDQKNGIGHDVYRGKVYYVDGHPETYFSSDLKDKGYTVAEGPEEWDETGLIRKYKLVKSGSTPSGDNQPSAQNPEGGSKFEGKTNQKPTPNLKQAYDRNRAQLEALNERVNQNTLDYNKRKLKRDSQIGPGFIESPYLQTRYIDSGYAEGSNIEQKLNEQFKRQELQGTSNANYNVNAQLARNEQALDVLSQFYANLAKNHTDYVNNAIETADKNRNVWVETLNSNNERFRSWLKQQIENINLYDQKTTDNKNAQIKGYIESQKAQFNNWMQAQQSQLANQIQKKYYEKFQKLSDEAQQLQSKNPEPGTPEYIRLQEIAKEVENYKVAMNDEINYFKYQAAGIDPDTFQKLDPGFKVSVAKHGIKIDHNKVQQAISFLKNGDAVKIYQADKKAQTAKYIAKKKSEDERKKRNHNMEMQALRGMQEIFLKSFDL